MYISDSLQELLNKAGRLANGRRIRKINATLGELTGLSHEQVLAEFVHHRQHLPDGVAVEAQLELTHEAGRALCLTCGQEAPTALESPACPVCGSQRRRVIAGQHLTLDGMSLMERGATRPPASAPTARSAGRGKARGTAASVGPARVAEAPRRGQRRAPGRRVSSPIQES